MATELWLRTVDQRVTGYQRGRYTARELRAEVVKLMPVDGTAALVSRLPPEVATMLRDLAAETANYSEGEWTSLIVINSRQPDAADQELYRKKCEALQAYFAATQS